MIRRFEIVSLVVLLVSHVAAAPSPGSPAGPAATAPALGAAATTAPAPAIPGGPGGPGAAGQVEKLEITVTGVEGIVQVRAAEDQPWHPVTIGMKLDVGAEFRTGPRSAVRFVIPPDQTVTLDRLGTLKILQAIRDATKVKTDLGMKYGRTRYDIEAAGIEHQSNIRGPGSTLAVRGTKVSLYDQPPFEPEVRSLTGRAVYVNAKKARIPFGAKGQKAAVTGEEASAAHHEIAKTRLNPISLADSDDQQRLFFVNNRTAQQLSSIISTFADFKIIQAGLTPVDPTVNLTRPILPDLGKFLAFDLTWTGTANVNLIVSNRMDTLLAASPVIHTADGMLRVLNEPFPRTLRGGLIDPGPFDAYQSAPPTDGGRETAYWTKSIYASGTYAISANLTNGKAADLTLDVYQNGSLLEADTMTGKISSHSPTKSFHVTITNPSSSH